MIVNFGLWTWTFEKAETAKEGESLNKIRRDSRLTRRRIRRRAFRLTRLRRLLFKAGLVTSPNIEDINMIDDAAKIEKSDILMSLANSTTFEMHKHLVSWVLFAHSKSVMCSKISSISDCFNFPPN